MERFLAGCGELRSDDPDPELVDATRAFVSELHELASINAAREALVCPTDFRKDSPGGMQSSKRYFDVTALEIQDAESLAEELRS